MSLFILVVVLFIAVFVAIKKSKNKKQATLTQNSTQTTLTHTANDQKTDIKSLRKEVNNTIVNKINNEFQAMDGWNKWDKSIHQAYGQIERMQRAIQQNIKVIIYDTNYKLAKVRGSKFDIYLTCSEWCSCMDFRERHLPCKHMYALAIELDGDINKHITDTEYVGLKGLKIALAGTFTNKRDDPNGIRAKINSRNGIWTDQITKDSSILVCGNSPSMDKVAMAKQNSMPIYTEQEIMDIFSD